MKIVKFFFRSIIPPHLAQILPADKEGKVGISGIARRKQILPLQSKLPRHLHQPMKIPNNGPNGPQRHPIDSMPRMMGNMPPSFMQVISMNCLLIRAITQISHNDFRALNTSHTVLLCPPCVFTCFCGTTCEDTGSILQRKRR